MVEPNAAGTPLPLPHILAMAVQIDSLRLQREHKLDKAKADEAAGMALEAWTAGFTSDRSHGCLLFDLAVTQAQAVWDALAQGSRLVGKLKERDSMTYVIKLEPGRMITARSLGKQLTALTTLLTAEAKQFGAATLQAMVGGITYDPDGDNEIRIQLSLFHAAGIKKEATHA